MNKSIDLTQGSTSKILVRLSLPIVFAMLMQTLNLMADLYFVSRLGPDAVTALSISANAFFIIYGLSFVIGTGSMALIAQAVGRKNEEQAGRVFQQSLILSLISGIVTCLIGLAIARPYIDFLGGKENAFQWGVEYFQIFSVSFLVLQVLFVISSCYRGTGDTKTPMIIGVQSTALNIVLAPFLIFGWLDLPSLGVRGAAIASLSSQLYGLGIYIYLILVKGSPLRTKGSWRLDIDIIKRILSIGVPSGLSFFFLALNMLITYRVMSVYGTPALASVGIGSRILQALYLPVVAITSAMAAIIGQNYGAGHHGRIRETLRTGWGLASGVMISGSILCWILPTSLIKIFSNDPDVLYYGYLYITIVSLGNVMVGTIMAISAVFQGVGKTYPTLLGAAIDNALFALFVFTLPGYFGWGVEAIWWIKLATALIEMFFDGEWLRQELRRVYSFLQPQSMDSSMRIPVHQR
ncbi:MAG: MATE family efflux transporter [Deltaproteobacteria bacterium]|nr:MATE family efflux transporter [Deltaproteobacteria bacterium]